MKARVFEQLDGSVRIMRLNEKMRLTGESDDAFAARMFPIEQAKDVSLSGLVSSDVDAIGIPTSRADRKNFKLRMRAGKMRVEVVKV